MCVVGIVDVVCCCCHKLLLMLLLLLLLWFCSGVFGAIAYCQTYCRQILHFYVVIIVVYPHKDRCSKLIDPLIFFTETAHQKKFFRIYLFILFCSPENDNFFDFTPV